MNLEFDCAHCNQHLSVESSAAGQPVKCPACGNAVTVPAAPLRIPLPQTGAGIIYCTRCGQRNAESDLKCSRCSSSLQIAAQPQYVVSGDGTMGGLIPYKNPKALWAYYLGVFSLIPCFGIPLGVAALVLGIKGLKVSALQPERGGKAHAWIGIVLGGLCAAVYIVALVAVAILAWRH